MRIKTVHFDLEKTQEWFYLFLLINGYEIGEEIPNHAYTLWNSRQWQEFKRQNGYAENVILHHIENWEERFTSFLKAQLPIGEERKV